MATNLKAVLRQIEGITDPEHLDAVLTALTAAHERLEKMRAGLVYVGAHVTLQGVNPPYLDTLQGTLVSIEDDETGTVQLTTDSTGRLRFMPQNVDFPVGGESHYTVCDVPLSCCHLATNEIVAA